MSPSPFFIHIMSEKIVQPDAAARAEYDAILFDTPTVVGIPGTRRHVKLRGLKPYTLERLTRLWAEREAAVPESSSDTLKSMCREPYFSIKQAVLYTLNSFWGISLFYWAKWRIWAYFRGYTEEQMLPIIAEAKKKVPLTAHWTNMVLSVDMRTDWMNLTKEEAEQFQAERLSAGKRHSQKSIPNTGSQGGSSSGLSASGAGGTGAS